MYKKKVRRFDAVLRRRLCEMAASHVRYGYRRLTVLLRRKGWKVNAKRIYRLYTEEQLIVRTKQQRKIARRQRGTMTIATAPNQCWSISEEALECGPIDVLVFSVTRLWSSANAAGVRSAKALCGRS